MSDCAGYRQEIAAYVLDGLPADEAQAIEAHLEDCLDCRAELAELRDVPALLDLARQAPVPVPARVRDRVVAQAARRQGRRRWLAAVAAAALVAAALGGLAGWRLNSPAPVAVAVPLQHVEPFEASGWASFRSVGGQIQVHVDIQDLEPLAAPAVYEAWVSTYGGRTVSVGQLSAGADGSVTASLVARGDPDAYRGFWITAEPDRRDPAHDGPTVLQAPIPTTRSHID